MSEEAGASPALRAGDLLVATPSLLDPNFERTVVLLLDVSDGALGVVLNRPSVVRVAEVLPDWEDLVEPLGVLFSGGPVGADSALAVGVAAATVRSPEDELVGFRPLWDGVGIVDLDSPTALVGPALSSLRVFAGYAGWGAEQLRGEIASGSWYVVPSETGDLTSLHPQRLWSQVLRRQPGELAWVSTRPGDPTLN